LLDDRDPASLSPEDVAAVLATLDRLGPALGPADRETFAFNVLVNALSTVIERIRLSEPDLVATYVAAARSMLQDT
jgi:DNA replication initiation complex subunit (GINS family)